MNERTLDKFVGITLFSVMAVVFMREWGILLPGMFLGFLGLVAYWVTFEYEPE